ncbi:c-type cytochrome [Albidovulum sediminicola]|uniref:C-type cytochrome n=1 Tax=Albidovulum sediminicola TaxID=2984331 RepID=A0ABT2YXK2_9RHOB|nr:c-type cytochrome [Defluviimonas sp. WL0075]MCV2863604.1 c-type cytochrome [Defluviimonas sp. WL0075]
MSKSLNLLAGTVLAAGLAASPALAEKMGLGRAALPEEIAAWDVSVLPDGTGLPEGEGDVLTGDEVFADKCASCHGEFAEGLDSWPVLAGGAGTLHDRRPVKTIGSYWPYLSTVFDYVHRSMPFGGAQTVTNDEAYAITAFLLYSNGLVEDDFVLSNENFTEIVLPNAEGFYPDDRAESEYPLFSAAACMSECGPEVKITKRAVEINVTPEDPDGRPAGTLPDYMASAMGAAPEASPEPAAEEAVEEAAVDTAEAMAAVDPEMVEDGQKVFKKCAACHKVGEGAKNGTGPHLNGALGRAAGSLDGFKYSKAMTDAGAGGLVWDEASLMSFLENPKGFLKGTKMSFAGLKKEDDRAAIVAYLSTLAP